jgi:hypothetical protein
VRCIAPDVGGGFGVKGHVYPEDIMIAFLSNGLTLVHRPYCGHGLLETGAPDQ